MRIFRTFSFVIRCSNQGQCRVGAEGLFECRCFDGFDGADCSLILEKDCKDGKDNDKGLRFKIVLNWIDFQIFLILLRWLNRLRRSWMLLASQLCNQSTLCIQSKAHRHPPPQTTAGNHRNLLRTHEIHNWWGQLTKLCQTRNV